jgi:hypothetical protein
VKCRGVQTDNLGKIGIQHCDAQVTDSSGQLWSLSGGPQPNYMSITALNAWATSPPTEPFTGTTVYQGNSCTAAGCMIQSTQAWNQDIVKPEYRAGGPSFRLSIKQRVPHPRRLLLATGWVPTVVRITARESHQHVRWVRDTRTQTLPRGA